MTEDTVRSSKRDLTKGAILPHVVRIALPMAWGITAIISFALADTYFVGQLGAVELAAMGFTHPVTMFFFNITFGLAIGMSSVVSRRIGNKKPEEVRIIITIGLVIALLFSLLLVVIAYQIMDPVFMAMGADSEILPFIHDYMHIWLVGALFLPIPIVANAALRGMGDATMSAVVMSIVALVNIVLDPIFIFGLFGFPRMALQGAALATAIGYFVGMVVILSILIFREKVLVLSAICKRTAWRMTSSSLLTVAIPVSLASIIAPMTFYGFNYILSDLGNEAVAAYGIVNRFEAFLVIPIMALAGGIAPIIGQNWGAGLQNRVRAAITISVKLCLIYTVISMAFVFAFNRPVVHAFNENDVVRHFAMGYLVWTTFSYVGFYFSSMVGSMMNALGWAKINLSLIVVRSFVVALPLAFLLVPLYKETGFFMANTMVNIFGVSTSVYFLHRMWVSCPVNNRALQ